MSGWSAERRKAQARALYDAIRDIQREQAERAAVSVDGGLGIAAAAAIAAAPPGLARELEVARWVRRVDELGVDQVAHVFTPGMSRDEAEAHAAFAFALAQRRGGGLEA